MKINLTELSDKALSTLIIKAMEEWASRQGAAPRTVVSRRPLVTRQVAIDEPPPEDKEFALQVDADGRRIQPESASVSLRSPSASPPPTEKGTAAWRDAGRLLHRYTPAEER